MDSSLIEHYKKSVLAEVLQSRQELHQVRQATSVAVTGTWAVEKAVRKEYLLENVFVCQSELSAIWKLMKL